MVKIIIVEKLTTANGALHHVGDVERTWLADAGPGSHRRRQPRGSAERIQETEAGDPAGD